MAEYISCRNCDSAYCDGCNIYTLATMLQEGKFDCLMDENCSVNRFVDVAPVVRGEWIAPLGMAWNYVCSCCGYGGSDTLYKRNFCPNCGADMRERKGDE